MFRPDVFVLLSIGGGGDKIFSYRKVGENLSSLWNQSESQTRNPVRLITGNRNDIQSNPEVKAAYLGEDSRA